MEVDFPDPRSVGNIGNYELNNHIEFEGENEDLPDHIVPPLPDEEGMPRACRSCQEEDPESDLIAPCRCSGSIKYVHRKCLDEWRAVSANPESFSKCDICKQLYFMEEVVTNDSKWRKTKFVLVVLRDIFLLLIAIQLVVGACIGIMAIVNYDTSFFAQLFPSWWHKGAGYILLDTVTGLLLLFAVVGVIGLFGLIIVGIVSCCQECEDFGDDEIFEDGDEIQEVRTHQDHTTGTTTVTILTYRRRTYFSAFYWWYLLIYPFLRLSFYCSFFGFHRVVLFPVRMRMGVRSLVVVMLVILAIVIIVGAIISVLFVLVVITFILHRHITVLRNQHKAKVFVIKDLAPYSRPATSTPTGGSPHNERQSQPLEIEHHDHYQQSPPQNIEHSSSSNNNSLNGWQPQPPIGMQGSMLQPPSLVPDVVNIPPPYNYPHQLSNVGGVNAVSNQLAPPDFIPLTSPIVNPLNPNHVEPTMNVYPPPIGGMPGSINFDINNNFF